MMVRWLENNAKWSAKETKDRLSFLPQTIQEKALRYKRWQDLQACVLSRELLQQSLCEFTGKEQDYLSEIWIDENGKPHLKQAIYFSVSHTDGAVIVAVSDKRVGVDIESIRTINIQDFKQFLTTKEWNDLHETASTKQSFYELWTQKEAVLKADGRGLSIPLKEVVIVNDEATLRGIKFEVSTVQPTQGLIYSIAFSQ